MEIVYLDSNATTKPAPEVIGAMMPYFTEYWGNPSSAHRFGQLARRAVDDARSQVSKLIGVADGEVYFTGTGTEASNTCFRGLLKGRSPRRKVVTSAVEHSATKEMAQAAAREDIEIVQIPVDIDGELDLDALGAALDDSVAFVTMLWANNETGVLFPANEIAKKCRDAGVPFHCDAAQCVGKIAVDLKAVGCDCATLDAHKFHGPKGVGAIYARRGLRLAPLMVGGPQERGRRGGTENVPGIVGMGKAAELAGEKLPEYGRVAEMRDRFETDVIDLLEDVQVIGGGAARLPNTTNLGFARLEAEAILMLLSEQGVCASAGAACSSGSLEPSHVLLAMGVPAEYAHGAIRFSLSRYTTENDLDRALAILPGVIERLRAVLPVGV